MNVQSVEAGRIGHTGHGYNYTLLIDGVSTPTGDHHYVRRADAAQAMNDQVRWLRHHYKLDCSGSVQSTSVY